MHPMKILIVTPLFPPDTAPSAVYTKELARRLSSEHQVTVLLYGHLPESIPNVTLVSVDKRRAASWRLWSFMWELQKESSLADIILVQNGPSVELPCLFTLRFRSQPVILVESDQPALQRTNAKPYYKNTHQLLRARVSSIYSATKPWPNEKPLIHPLKPYPEKEMVIWEKSWKQHLQQLETLFIKHHV